MGGLGCRRPLLRWGGHLGGFFPRHVLIDHHDGRNEQQNQQSRLAERRTSGGRHETASTGWEALFLEKGGSAWGVPLPPGMQKTPAVGPKARKCRGLNILPET